MMGVAENKAAFAGAIEEFNKPGDKVGYLDLYSPSLVVKGLPPEVPPNHDGLRDFYIDVVFPAFPDGVTTIQEMVGEGDRLVVHISMTGTHQAEFMGVPATGKPIELTGVMFFTFDGSGKVVERWGLSDALGLLAQLGVNPLAGENASLR